MKPSKQPGVVVNPPPILQTLCTWVTPEERELLYRCPAFLAMFEKGISSALDSAIAEMPPRNRHQSVFGVHRVESGGAKVIGGSFTTYKADRKWVQYATSEGPISSCASVVVTVMAWLECNLHIWADLPEPFTETLEKLIARDDAACEREFIDCYEYSHRHHWNQISASEKAEIGHDLAVACALKGWLLASTHFASMQRRRADMFTLACELGLDRDPEFEAHDFAHIATRFIVMLKKGGLRKMTAEGITVFIALLYDAYLCVRLAALSIVSMYTTRTGHLPGGPEGDVNAVVGADGHTTLRAMCMQNARPAVSAKLKQTDIGLSPMENIIDHITKEFSLTACKIALSEVSLYERMLSREFEGKVGEGLLEAGAYEHFEQAAAGLQRLVAEENTVRALVSQGALPRAPRGERLRVELPVPVPSVQSWRRMYYNLIYLLKVRAYEVFLTIIASYKANAFRDRPDRRKVHQASKQSGVAFSYSASGDVEDVLNRIGTEPVRIKHLSGLANKLENYVPWVAKQDARDLYLYDILLASRLTDRRLRTIGITPTRGW